MTDNEMQLGFMLDRGTIDVVFIMRRQEEEYHGKMKTMYMRSVDQEKA